MSLPSSPAVPTESIVRAELLKVVVDGSLTNISSGIFSAIAIATVFPAIDESGSSTMAWIWCALAVVVMLRGIWQARQASRGAGRDTRRLLRYETRIVFQGVCTSVVWGAASWMLLPTAASAAEAFLMTAMALVVMGAAGNQAAHQGILLSCTLCLAGVFAAGLARFGDPYHIVLAVAFAVYGLITVWVARNQGIAVRQQILLNLENRSLRTLAEAERARADSASQAKTAFLAAASHDLRQPLHALVQYSAHLSRANQDPELNDAVRCIGSSVDAMRGLLDSILDLSKLMVGGVRPILAAFPIELLLERLDVQLRPLAAAKGLQFTATRSRAIVMSDDVLLERILRNLILNAIRYTNHGHVTIRCSQRRNKLQIQVWDTGIGIPRSDLSQIFDPYYQVDNRARDRGKGLGLGLAIARQLCDLLGYRIRVKTKVGKGTVFAVTVPLGTDSRLAHVPRTPSDSSVRDYVRGAFVVLVDDDALSRDASAHTLKAFGCRVIAAASAAEAIEKLEPQEFAPQLIVADYRREAETGVEAIQVVTANLQILFGESFSIPALVVSSGTAPDEPCRVSEHGYPMLHKPVAPEDLWGAMNRLLERKAQETEF